ncbi:helix-hairpin-helix domain-containing protein [Streptomyces sp. NPDC088254]|uniref:helix-hairpin-helix domain-containing protein n=1 Tax=Streptomyces sp. NPDC088254 TaxID=3365847 RepID=UPI0037FDC0D4
MALRSRSHATNPTSGPGRRPGSDGRLRHRRTPARGRVGGRPAPAEELRRRAELLFGGPGGEPADRGGRGESGSGPPGHDGAVGGGRAAGGASGEPAQPSGGVLVAADEPDEVVVDGFAGRLRPLRPEDEETRAAATATTTTTAAVDGADWRTRAGLALRERIPVWVQAHCGLEARSVIALSVVVVAVAAFAVQHFWSGGAQTVRAPEVVRAASYEEGERSGPGSGREAPAGASGAAAGAAGGAAGVVGARGRTGAAGTAEIVVDVSGKVREPGIHRLPAGSRVVDALNAAGGVRPGTNTDGLNRARFLVDGEQVVVGGAVMGGGGAVGGGAASGPAAGGAAGPGAGAGVPVSLNTATVEQLDALPGVGPVLARHIVDYRAQQGGFRSVDELREVNGIGQRRFADLRDLVRP